MRMPPGPGDAIRFTAGQGFIGLDAQPVQPISHESHEYANSVQPIRVIRAIRTIRGKYSRQRQYLCARQTCYSSVTQPCEADETIFMYL